MTIPLTGELDVKRQMRLVEDILRCFPDTHATQEGFMKAMIIARKAFLAEIANAKIDRVSQ